MRSLLAPCSLCRARDACGPHEHLLCLLNAGLFEDGDVLRINIFFNQLLRSVVAGKIAKKKKTTENA